MNAQVHEKVQVHERTLSHHASSWHLLINQGNYGRSIYIADKSTKFGTDVRFDLLIIKKI